MLAQPPAYDTGDWWPAWSTLLLPFVCVLWALVRRFKESVNWPAAFSTALLFQVIMFPAEAFSVSRGHWVYNEARIWGLKVLNVPLEEPFLYYFFGPMFLIVTMQSLRRVLRPAEE